MRRAACSLLLFAACGSACGDGAPAGNAPAAAARLEVKPLLESARVYVDGKAEPWWRHAPELVVPLQGPGGPREVRLRATADRRRLYLLIQWPDPQPSHGDYWKWGAGRVWSMHKGQDGFAILWGPGAQVDTFREQGCALYCHDDKHGYEAKSGFADIWFWSAQRSNFLGHLIDSELRFGKNGGLRPDRAKPDTGNIANENFEFRGPLYAPLRVNPDPAKLSHRVLFLNNAQRFTLQHQQHLNRPGFEVAAYVLRPGKGSLADVQAVGLHKDGTWLVEMARDLNTEHTDDIPLGDPLVQQWFSIAVWDGTAGAEHARSGPVQLRFAR